MIQKTNGKLYVTGEYQVLNKKGIAVIYGIPKYISFKISESNKFSYGKMNEEETFTFNEKELKFENDDNLLVQKSFLVAFKYLQNLGVEITPFVMNIESELEDTSGNKYGFGSSSAVISGIIKSVLNYFNCDINNIILFKLAVLAQIHADNLSSGGDLASSIYGNLVYYRHYNLKWVLKRKDNIKIVNKSWPHLVLLPFKTDILFGAVWTKSSFKTKELTNDIDKSNLKVARCLVQDSYKELRTNDYINLKKTIKSYQQWFEDVLSEEGIITSDIKTAIKILNKYMLAAKISGAGGGDSVIFIYPNDFNFEGVKKELSKNNLELILFEVENDK